METICIYWTNRISGEEARHVNEHGHLLLCNGGSTTTNATLRNTGPLELRYPHRDKFSINYTER